MATVSTAFSKISRSKDELGLFKEWISKNVFKIIFQFLELLFAQSWFQMNIATNRNRNFIIFVSSTVYCLCFNPVWSVFIFVVKYWIRIFSILQFVGQDMSQKISCALWNKVFNAPLTKISLNKSIPCLGVFGKIFFENIFFATKTQSSRNLQNWSFSWKYFSSKNISKKGVFRYTHWMFGN